MPPKPKNTKEEVIQCALSILRESGVDALTARSLGKRLGSAPSSVFTHFSSMEQVKAEATQAAREIYCVYVQRGLRLNPPFKGFALEFIHFAANEPKLFALLFMNPGGAGGIGDVIGMEGHAEMILRAASETFQLDPDSASLLYHDLWIYCHGIASLTATGVCAFSDEELSQMFGNACRGFLMALKAPADSRTAVIPQFDTVVSGTVESYYQSGGTQ